MLIMNTAVYNEEKILERIQPCFLCVPYILLRQYIIEVNPFHADHNAMIVVTETTATLLLLYTSFITDVIIGMITDGTTPPIIVVISLVDIGRYFKRLMRSIINGTKLSTRKKHDWAAYPERLSFFILLITGFEIIIVFLKVDLIIKYSVCKKFSI